MPSPLAASPPTAPCAPGLMAARLDEYLPGLQSDKARRVFLRSMDAKLREAYGTYLRTGRITTHPSFEIHSEFDFSLTILDVNKRLDALTDRVPA